MKTNSYLLVSSYLLSLSNSPITESTPNLQAQFTADFGLDLEWTQALIDAKVKISMDGRGRWIDNRMIERLWRSLKYECIYLNAFETGSQTRTGIGKWLTYNNDRPNMGIGGITPAMKLNQYKMAA